MIPKDPALEAVLANSLATRDTLRSLGSELIAGCTVDGALALWRLRYPEGVRREALTSIETTMQALTKALFDMGHLRIVHKAYGDTWAMTAVFVPIDCTL